MRFFLPLILALMSPIPAMASKHQAANIPANPATSQELNSLNVQRTELQDEHNALTGKQDFWHGVTIVLGVIAAFIGILAGAAALMESKRSYNQRDVGNQLAIVDGQIGDWKKKDADWRILDAKTFAAKAIGDAAEATKTAEDEKLERLKLEAKIAPRRLDKEQQTKIANNCALFSNLFNGKRVKVVSYSLDTEAFVLSEQIVAALRASGMTVDDDAMSITPVGTLIFGINVFGSDSELAKKIADAIGSSGKPVAVGFVETDPTAGSIKIEYGAPPPQAIILVGIKMPDKNTIDVLVKTPIRGN